MAGHDAYLIHYAEGRGVNLGKAKNKVLGWGLFCKQFSTPTKTKERRKVFDKLSKEQQDDLKAIDGWIIGTQIAEGTARKRNNLKHRDLLTLDIDYATPELVDEIETGFSGLSDYEFFVHSSRRHTAEKPRLRLFAPLTRPVNHDEYLALARILGMRLEHNANPMVMVDKVSFRIAQMMFKPTTSIDGDWFTKRNKGEMIDPDAIFAWYEQNYGEWTNYADLPKTADEKTLRKAADKAENPTEKKGPVGDFCRAYDVEAAIAKFLPDVYVPGDASSTDPRYTYVGGTTTDGAVVHDNGLFLYSHHGTDPCADMLVNAFDLVRIHLFGDADEGVEEGTPPAKMPSFKMMLDHINGDPEYTHARAASRYDIAAMFDDVVEELEAEEDPEPEDEIDPLAALFGGEPELSSGSGFPVDATRPKKKKRSPPKDWFPDALEFDLQGKIISSMPNAAVIIHNDARLFEAIAFNDFTKQIVCRRSIKSNLEIAPSFICSNPVNGDRWQDHNDITIRMILEAPNGAGKVGYGMRITDRDLNGAVVSASRRNTFHPVKDYLSDLEWDGVPRVDSLLVRYLKVRDSDYHREAIRMMLVASVTRIFEPGHKFDFAMILQGPQGIRKSSLIQTLYGTWFGELGESLDNMQGIAEAIAGKWGVELPEMSGFHKSDFNAAKMFLRRQFDDVRMAYDRRVSEFPRQCVVYGTTNDLKYLKDPTGNRSYWPVVIVIEDLPTNDEGEPYIDTDAVAEERDQIWAEAVAIYRQMRAEQPRGTLPLYLRSAAAQKEALMLQNNARTEDLHEMWAERITEWLEKPATLAHLLNEYDAPHDEKFNEIDGKSPDEIMVQRIGFTREQAVQFALGKERGIVDYQTAQNIEKALPLISNWLQRKDPTKGTARFRLLGKQGRWWLRVDATPDELRRGYRFARDEDDDDYLQYV